MEKPKKTKICRCGKEFVVKPCYLNDPSKKYCSNKCRYESYRERMKYKKFKCAVCGNEFQRSLTQLCGGTRKYCSKKCQSIGIQNRREITCVQCGKSYAQKASKVNIGKNFCGIECRNAWIRENPPPAKLFSSADNRGEKNGQYKHGKYVGKGRPGGDANKKKIREVLKECDGNWCLLCGKPGPGLHMHRVIYGSQGGKYEVGNCALLCGEHHGEVHSSKRKWFPILDAHLKARAQKQAELVLRG